MPFYFLKKGITSRTVVSYAHFEIATIFLMNVVSPLTCEFPFNFKLASYELARGRIETVIQAPFHNPSYPRSFLFPSRWRGITRNSFAVACNFFPLSLGIGANPARYCSCGRQYVRDLYWTTWRQVSGTLRHTLVQPFLG